MCWLCNGILIGLALFGLMDARDKWQRDRDEYDRTHTYDCEYERDSAQALIDQCTSRVYGDLAMDVPLTDDDIRWCNFIMDRMTQYLAQRCVNGQTLTWYDAMWQIGWEGGK